MSHPRKSIGKTLVKGVASGAVMIFKAGVAVGEEKSEI